MKLKYRHIRLIELFLVLLMFGLALYSFSKNRVYDSMILLLQQLSALLKVDVDQPIYLIIFIIIPFLYFYAMGREEHMDGVYMMSWLMHLPSVLWYSGLDWLKVVGSPLNFQVLETRLSFEEVLLISAILVGGRILLFFTCQIRETLIGLRKRGADESDLEAVIPGMTGFALTLVTLSTALALAVSYLIAVTKELFNPVVALAPYPYVTFGVACLVAIPALVIIYFHSKAKD